MKYAVFTLFLAAVANAKTNQLDSCALQNDCIEFTAELLESSNCPEENGSCEYKVCATMSFSGDCAVSGNSAKMQSSCAKPDETCADGGEEGFIPFNNPLVTKHENLADGETQCQIVTGGMLAEFMFKDGGGCDDAAYSGYNLGNITAYCGASEGSSCTGDNKGCVWKAMAPACPDWDVRKGPSKPNPNSMATCELQQNCLDFTITEVTGDVPSTCDDGKEYYSVCATIDFSKPECLKDDVISHTCVGGEECEPQKNFLVDGFKQWKETPSIGDLYTECQTVQAGQTANFLFKDAQDCSLGESYSDPVTGYTCQPRGEETPSCTGNSVGQECVWTIPVPEAKTESPTASPTASPTESPTEKKVEATESPTESPTASPTKSPTESPTASPTASPTEKKVVATDSPTASPTASPTEKKVEIVVDDPVVVTADTESPTASPTASPTKPEAASPGSASGTGRSGDCMETVYENANGSGDLVCSENKVSLESVSAGSTMNCVEGDKVTIDVKGTVQMTDTFYDFGWYIAADAGDGLTGTCYTGFLDEDSTYTVNNGAVSCDSDPVGGADACCDVTMNGLGSIEDLSLSPGTIEVTCADIDSDGFLDFSICFTWRDATTDGACDSSAMYPGGSTICDCATYSIEEVTVTKATTTHSTCI